MSASIYSNSQFTDSPYGLKLQRTITATGKTSITDIPAGINRVYAIVIGGGGGGAGTTGSSGSGGGAGGYSAGWTYVSTTCTVGAGGAGGVTAVGTPGGTSIY